MGLAGGLLPAGFAAASTQPQAASPAKTLPASVDWASGIAFGPVGNVGPSAVADCAVAAIADIEQVLSRRAAPPSPAPYLEAYDVLARAEGETPGATAGLVPSAVLRRWETDGVAGSTIAAATSRKLDEASVEMALVEGPLYGVIDLPPPASTAGAWVNSEDVALNPWTMASPPSGYSGSGRHVVAIVGYDAADVLVATWGYVQPISWAVWSQIARAAWSVAPVGVAPAPAE